MPTRRFVTVVVATPLIAVLVSLLSPGKPLQPAGITSEQYAEVLVPLAYADPRGIDRGNGRPAEFHKPQPMPKVVEHGRKLRELAAERALKRRDTKREKPQRYRYAVPPKPDWLLAREEARR